VLVERDGTYEFSLRRWPLEAATAITAAMPAYKAVDGTIAAGVEFPAASAEFKIAGATQQKPVKASDQDVTFTADLKRGRTDLQTWFRDANGAEIAGAYFVYVTGPR
jgi:hypothetical protein